MTKENSLKNSHVFDVAEIIHNNNLLPLSGAHNFRDIGGMRTKDAKTVKWGRLFRSGELSKLTNEDKLYLDSIPLRTVVDFRDFSEIKREPDNLSSSVENRYHFPLAPGNLANNTTIDYEDFSSANAKVIMKEMYSELVCDPECVACYRQFFELVQNEKSLPLLYHCTAGKDRTGIATALIYSALNVDLENILENYMLSNEFLEEKYGNIKSRSEFFKTLLEVTPDLLYRTMEIIAKTYGNVENYLTEVLNVDINLMRRLYLDD